MFYSSSSFRQGYYQSWHNIELACLKEKYTTDQRQQIYTMGGGAPLLDQHFSSHFFPYKTRIVHYVNLQHMMMGPIHCLPPSKFLDTPWQITQQHTGIKYVLCRLQEHLSQTYEIQQVELNRWRRGQCYYPSVRTENKGLLALFSVRQGRGIEQIISYQIIAEITKTESLSTISSTV